MTELSNQSRPICSLHLVFLDIQLNSTTHLIEVKNNDSLGPLAMYHHYFLLIKSCSVSALPLITVTTNNVVIKRTGQRKACQS